MNKKVILTILDGWGLAEKTEFNAIENAKTPHFDKLIREYPNTRLKADGEAVGLPEGQFGTSEVNHMTIGAGRIIWQDLPKINKAIENGDFFRNEALLKVIQHVERNNSKLNLIGILSDGGVHSHINHLFALLDLLEQRKFKQIISIHVFTDGRDVAPKSAEKYLSDLQNYISSKQDLNIVISTLQGRSYLDRDRDWDRTEKAFALITKGQGKKTDKWQSAINQSYITYSTDEQLPQYLINSDGLMRSNDGAIIYHFRQDRIYQLIRRILDEKIENFEIASFMQASEDFTSVRVAFPREPITDTLAETIAISGKSQLHVTETEKFAHVTYFLNGEKEQEMTNETWKMIESNRYVKPYYNFEPNMRNFDIAKVITEGIESKEFDFMVANFSSADMVGHTGDYNAAVVSAQSVDFCLGKIYEVIQNKLDEYAWIITADHGNSEIMWDEENNQPHTQHTLSPVPFILVSNIDCTLHRRDTLSDIAPTVLDLLGIAKPGKMTGESLIIRK